MGPQAQRVDVRVNKDPGCCILFLGLGLIVAIGGAVIGWLSGGGWMLVVFPVLAAGIGWLLYLGYLRLNDERLARGRGVPSSQTRIEREARNVGLTVDAYFDRRARELGRSPDELKREAGVSEWRGSDVTRPGAP